ncbi:MAG: DUF3592 domain-containing protein [Litorimonas sp.]
MTTVKIIATLIFAPIVLFPFLGSAYFIYDRGEILLNSDWDRGEIVACAIERSKSRSPGVRRYSRPTTTYRAQVRTPDNKKITASLAPARSKDCRKHIGKTVRVLVHRTRPERSRINTFFQLWMIPCVYFLLSGAFAAAFITRPK